MTKRTKLYLILLAVIVLAIIVLLIWHGVSSREKPVAAETLPAAQTRESSGGVKLIEVEKTITTEILSEQLREVGLLVTQEYCFTEVVSFSSIKSLWNIDLGFTESSYLASYDGVVTAGVDFTQISVSKDDEQRCITIRLPRPRILGVDIDPKSFQLYSEKEGLWNRISVTDYNDSLIELEENAREKAIQKGVLERAGSGARSMIERIVGSLVDTSDYSVLCLYAEE